MLLTSIATVKRHVNFSRWRLLGRSLAAGFLFAPVICFPCFCPWDDVGGVCWNLSQRHRTHQGFWLQRALQSLSWMACCEGRRH